MFVIPTKYRKIDLKCFENGNGRQKDVNKLEYIYIFEKQLWYQSLPKILLNNFVFFFLVSFYRHHVV